MFEHEDHAGGVELGGVVGEEGDLVGVRGLGGEEVCGEDGNE